MITLEAQIASVEREIRMREKVYPRWTASGKLKKESADRELETMKAVLATLREIQAKQVPPLLAVNGG